MTGVFWALGIATVIAMLFYYLHLPVMVGFLFAGIILGPSGAGLLSSFEQIEGLTELAAVLLMFTIGLEFSFAKVRRFQRAFIFLGLNQMIIVGLLSSLGVKLFFNIHWSVAFCIGSIIALSSTAIVLKILGDKRELETPCGQASLSILILQDIAVLVIFLTLPLIAPVESDHAFIFKRDALRIFLKLFVLGGGVFAFVRYIMPPLLRKIAHTRSRELFFFSVIVTCGLIAHTVNEMGLSYSLGAFVAGMMIASSPFAKQALSEVLPLRDTFLALFFIAIGMFIDLSFLLQNFLSISLFTLSFMLLKMACIAFLVWLFGNPWNLAVLVGVVLMQMGEFSFVITHHAYQLDILSFEMSQYILSASILSLGLSPVLFRWTYEKTQFNVSPKFFPEKWIHKFSSARSYFLKKTQGTLDLKELAAKNPKDLENHVVVIGCGIGGRRLIDVLQNKNIPYIIIESNPKTVQDLAQWAPIIFGDATNPDTLKQIGIERARCLVITTSGIPMVRGIMRTVQNLNPSLKKFVRLQFFQEISQLKSFSHTDFAVGEFESTLELIYQVLRELECDGNTVLSAIEESQLEMGKKIDSLSGHRSLRFQRAKWESFARMDTLELCASDPAVGKSILELELRKNSGASLVCFIRKEEMFAPEAELPLQEGDLLYILGNNDQRKKAHALLKST